MTITPPDPDQAPDQDRDDEEPETPEKAADEGDAVEPPD
jgi:hypothetical protein